tara:strand:+ start:2684 stop:2920 length:237 start_codon:yes stop_codon:yes gene_type:complete
MRIIAILMILTLSSCMVSQKTFNELVAEKDAKISELKAENDAWLWKDQICRTKCSELIKELKDCNNAKNDTIEQPADE